ncbi:hypothetical protein HYW21_07215 [Candidatus Woesearchaeota archaeon]|nr:hypothetical protein [Candidatus Woesearchaeota archaeon]
MSTKGQITLFLIVGIVLVIVVGTLFTLTKGKTTTETKKQQEQAQESLVVAPTAQVYVESCLSNEAKNALFFSGFQGGYIWIPPSIPTLATFYANTSYWFYQGNDISPSTTLIAQQIADYVDQFALSCILALEDNLPGYNITNYGTLQSTVQIREEDVLVQTQFPLTIATPGNEQQIDAFNVLVPVPLGKVLTVGHAVVDLFAADPTMIDLSGIAAQPVDVAVYHLDTYEKVVTIREDTTQLNGYPLQFSFAVQMQPGLGNRAPIITIEPYHEAPLGLILLNITAVDPDHDPLTYAILDDQATINAEGMVSFTPTESGLYTPIVTVTDPLNASDFIMLMINVTG